MICLLLYCLTLHTLHSTYMCTYVHVHAVCIRRSTQQRKKSNLESCEELEVLQYSESVKEHIVLGTDAEAVSDLVHVAPYVITIDDGCSRRGCVQS